jgi:hypothetical protein
MVDKILPESKLIKDGHYITMNIKIFNDTEILSIQPLYYIAENIRQNIYKISGNDKFNAERLDNDFSLIDYNMDSNIAFDIELSKSKDKNDNNYMNDLCNKKNSIKDTLQNIDIVYIISKYTNSTLKFSYKSFIFEMQTDILPDITKTPLIIKYTGDIHIHSIYSIKFEQKDFNMFETFIQTTHQYTKKFLNNSKPNNKISMYISAKDGGFFEYLGDRQNRSMDSIYLPKQQKQDIITDMENFLNPKTKKRYSDLGINYKRTYMLEGVPGTGKTSLITGLASYFNYNIAIISFTPKMTDVDLLRIFNSLNKIEQDNYNEPNSSPKKCLLVIEDIDCIFKERKSHDESKNSITFSGLLNALDGISTQENLITFITTNYKNHLDNALVRPGRIDYVMRFDYATKEQIIDIYTKFTQTGEKTVNKVQVNRFYSECCSLNIKITTSLLQQYLMKYLDEPEKAIENIDELKTIFEQCKCTREADDTVLYS